MGILLPKMLIAHYYLIPPGCALAMVAGIISVALLASLIANARIRP